MSAKILVHCDWCGRELLRYRCQIGKHVFCCGECRSAFLSKATNPKGYPKHEHLSEYNREHNHERMTLSVRLKLRKSRLKESRKGYKKFLGVHEHRIIATIKLGRPLKPGEVVHHIDGDKQNNSPENLFVFTSQGEHALWHKAYDKKRGGAK